MRERDEALGVLHLLDEKIWREREKLSDKRCNNASYMRFQTALLQNNTIGSYFFVAYCVHWRRVAIVSTQHSTKIERRIVAIIVATRCKHGAKIRRVFVVGAVIAPIRAGTAHRSMRSSWVHKIMSKLLGNAAKSTDYCEDLGSTVPVFNVLT